MTPQQIHPDTLPDGPAPAPPRRARITLRAWIIGLALIPLLAYWLEYTEIVAAGPDLAAMSMPMAVLFALLVLIPINLLVKRWNPKFALTQPELMFIYTMNTVALYIGGIGMMQFLTPELVGWRHFATATNGWTHWFHDVPLWATPDESVVEGYYKGKTSFFAPEVWSGWVSAIAIWTAFIFVLLFATYCIATLIRRQWVEGEKLIFPIVIIPLEITRDGGNTPLWHNRLFWGGVLIPVVLETIAVLHFTMFPTMPYVPLKPEAKLDLGQYVQTPPWSAIGYTTMAFYPLVIGLTFLLSQEVSFSCWFFYLFTKLENVAATSFGFRDPGAGPALSRVPYTGEQGLGAFLGLALFSLYFARPHLAAAFRKAFRGDNSVDDADEPMSYRAAYLGLVISFVLLTAFAVGLGLSLLLALIFWTLFFLLALAFTRIRAEAGLPWGQGPGGLAHENMINFAGTQAFTGQQMTGLTFMRWFDSDWRCLAQPAQLEAMKIADSTEPRMNPRHLTRAILAATVVGSLATWVSCLVIYYHWGADSAHVNDWRTGQGHYGFDQLQGWLRDSKPFDAPRLGGALAGLLFVGFLSIMRTRFVWWPLHPIGYAVANTDTMTWIWFPTLLGWLCKNLTLRYGGIKTYRLVLPFFLGLILGDYAISCLWALFFLATGLPGYRTFPI